MSIFNLSNVKLSPTEEVLLGLGDKFLPSISLSSDHIHSSIINSIDKLERNMKLKLYFANSIDSQHSVIPPIKGNTFLPPAGQDYMTLIDKYISDIIKRKISKTKFISRLNQSETALLRSIIKQLSSKHDIIIKPADKNLGTVVLSKIDYNTMCASILQDISTYTRITTVDYHDTAWCLLESILQSHNVMYANKRSLSGSHNTLTKLARSLLQLKGSPNLRAAKFYVLPKVHKQPVVGRPIAASVNTITYYASKYLDGFLQPLMKKLPNICLSSRDVIKELTDFTIPDGAVILCADVRSLYPSIPLEYGLKAMKEILIRYNYEPELLSLALDLLRWVLTCNYITFNDEVYLQISGTAMGTPVAVCYANIVLFYLEQDCVLAQPSPLYYRRYIDDLFVIVRTEADAKHLVQNFNRQCTSIQLEGITIGYQGIFLDLSISISNNQLDFCLYQKPVNKYLYIHFMSSHSKHMLTNMIVQEIKRYRLYCSKDLDFNNAVSNFRVRLAARGYPDAFLAPLFASLPNRDHLLHSLRRNERREGSTKKREQGPIIVLQLPKLNNPASLKDLLAVSQGLKSHPRYYMAYKDKELVIGKKHFKKLRNYFANTSSSEVHKRASKKRLSDDSHQISDESIRTKLIRLN